MSVQRFYWDANVFHALFNEEAGRIDACRQIAKMAEAGTVTIVTSALTYVECVRLHNQPRTLTEENENTIRLFFQRGFIEVQNVTRKTGEDARQLLWKHSSLQYKDAIHVATALFAKVDLLQTYDTDLLKLSGQYGTPRLRIAEPSVPTPPQPPFDLFRQ